MAKRRNPEAGPEDVTSDEITAGRYGDEEVPEPEVGEPGPMGSMDILSRLTLALEGLAARQDRTPQSDAIMDKLAIALERVSGSQLDGAKLIAETNKRIHRPENQVGPDISVFNPRGEKDFPKPRLKCEFLMPWPADWESMTREECELLNLVAPGEWLIRRIDMTKVKVTVRMITKLDSDEPSRIVINHDTAFNNDNHRLLPPDWIRQLARANPKTRAKVDAVLTMDEEYALIESGLMNDGNPPDPEINHGRLLSIGE